MFLQIDGNRTSMASCSVACDQFKSNQHTIVGLYVYGQQLAKWIAYDHHQRKYDVAK